MSITLSVFIPVVTALIEVVKKAFKEIPNDFLPLLSIAFGILVAFLTEGQVIFGIEIEEMTIPVTILAGAILGLSASGFFSGIKSATYVAKEISDKIKKINK